MKTKKLLGLSLILTFGLASCSKNQKSTYSTSTIGPGQKFTVKAYQNWGEKPNDYRASFFLEKEEKLKALSEGKFKGASGDETLEDTFMALEAILHNVFSVELNIVPDFITMTESIELPVYESNGDYWVQEADYFAAYGDLHNAISAYYQDHTNEVCYITDLLVTSIRPDEGYATIALELYSVPAAPTTLPIPYLTPNEPYYAAQKLGACNSSNHAGLLDAAGFIEFYANNTADWKLRCTNGAYYNHVSAFFGYMPTDSSLYWHSRTNDCIGAVENDEWLHWYNMIDLAIAECFDYFKSTGSLSANHEFFGMSYHGIKQPTQVIKDVNFTFVHKGTYEYGIITCY